MKANKLVQLILVVSSLVLMSPGSYAAEEGIEVTGMAKLKLAPDMASFLFAINDRGQVLDDLMKEIDKKTSAVIALCKNLGIEAKNISSTEISIYPRYNYKTGSFVAYEVSRNIKVILNDLDKYSALVNGAVKSGVTTLRSISLDVKSRTELERKSLASALADAREKAETLAKSGGVSLGKILSVKEAGSPVRFDTMRLERGTVAESLAQKGAFEPGEITVTGSVVARYAIK